MRARHANGETFPVELVISMIDGGDGQEAVAVVRDVSVAESTRLERERTNALFERMFSSVQVLMAYLDRDFNFIRVNRAYAEADGRTPEAMIGLNHFDLYPNEQSRAIFEKVRDSGEPYTVNGMAFVYPHDPERGVTYWNWVLHPLPGAGGQTEGLLLSLVNVTETYRDRVMDRLVREIDEKVLGRPHGGRSPAGHLCATGRYLSAAVCVGRAARDGRPRADDGQRRSNNGLSRGTDARRRALGRRVDRRWPDRKRDSYRQAGVDDA
jgi:PAS domain S-box-containing protein